MSSFSAAAHSGTPEPAYSKDFFLCTDNAGGVTVALRECTSTELQRQDQRLNRVYQKLFQKAAPEMKKKLKAAQLAWIQFRDKQCELDGATAEDGTLGPLLVDSCHLEMTARRADALEKLAKMP